jgi:hypothetical protein
MYFISTRKRRHDLVFTQNNATDYGTYAAKACSSTAWRWLPLKAWLTRKARLFFNTTLALKAAIITNNPAAWLMLFNPSCLRPGINRRPSCPRFINRARFFDYRTNPHFGILKNGKQFAGGL